MICSNCGTIIQHTDSKIQYYVEDKSHEYGYIMQRKDIEISIICPGCQANEKWRNLGELCSISIRLVTSHIICETEKYYYGR